MAAKGGGGGLGTMAATKGWDYCCNRGTCTAIGCIGAATGGA